jgi:archaellum component FlaC
MEAMRESWTDDRLDHLSRKVDERFERVDERFDHVDERFEQIDGRFDRVEAEARGLRSEVIEFRSEVNARLDSMQRVMIQFLGGMLAATIAALIGLVATQA